MSKTRDATSPKPQDSGSIALTRKRSSLNTPKQPMTSPSTTFSSSRGLPPFVAELTQLYMSKTLFKSIGLTKTRLPLFRGSNLIFPSRAAVVHSTSSNSSSATTKRHKPRVPRKTRRHEPSDLKHQITLYLRAQAQDPATKMSFLLPGLRRGLMLSTPLILSTPLLLQSYRNYQPIRCDGPDALSRITNDLTRNYASEARTPVITESGAANPRAVRQVSMGSILGVFCGLGISVFSKPLAILIGLGIFVLQVSFSCQFLVVNEACLYAISRLSHAARKRNWEDADGECFRLLSPEVSTLYHIRSCSAGSSRRMSSLWCGTTWLSSYHLA
jgi:hypothetical protein